MPRRDDLIDLFTLDEAAFASAVDECLASGVDTARRREVARAGPEAFAGPDDLAACGVAYDDLTRRERDLVWRLWLLDESPFGLTLSGPAYQDNPIRYVNRTFRRLTGYPLEALVGENPRLLQGPDTDPGAVAALREAIDIWAPVTVELTNYRADGSPFRNRVSLLPVEDETGTVSNWIGVQDAVDDTADRR